MEHKQKTFEFETLEEMMAVFGNLDEYIKMIEKATGAQIVANNGNALIIGDESATEEAYAVLKSAAELFRNN